MYGLRAICAPCRWHLEGGGRTSRVAGLLFTSRRECRGAGAPRVPRNRWLARDGRMAEACSAGRGRRVTEARAVTRQKGFPHSEDKGHPSSRDRI